MSLANKVDEIVDVIQDDTYNAIEDMGGEIPEDLTIRNLSNAIKSIPQGINIVWNQLVTEGIKIAELIIGEEKTDIFIPEPEVPELKYANLTYANRLPEQDEGEEDDVWVFLGLEGGE